MNEEKDFKVNFAGKEFSVHMGDMAGQADGAVTVRYGDTMVLATVVVANEPREGVDFFPLLIDYEERLYAAALLDSDGVPERTALSDN